MRITGYRSLMTRKEWGRPIGDINGVLTTGITEVPALVLESDTGQQGIGLGPHPAIEQVFPAVEGQDPRGVTALYDAILGHVFKAGHVGAVFGEIGVLDMALWDLKAKAADEPLWRTLGASSRAVPAYASGLDAGLDAAGLAALYGQFGEAGFTIAKLKGGHNVAADLYRFDVVEEVLRGVTDSDPVFLLDVNENWNAKQAVRYLSKLEERRDIAWIEEPVRRWDATGLATVSRSVRAAVATGENLSGLEQFRPLVTAGAADVIQTGSCWGITHFLRVAGLALAFDLLVSPVAYHGNPLASAAAALPNCLPIEVQDLHDPAGLQVDQHLADGQVILGNAPGLGISLDEDALRPAAASWAQDVGPHVRPRRAGNRLDI